MASEHEDDWADDWASNLGWTPSETTIATMLRAAHEAGAREMWEWAVLECEDLGGSPVGMSEDYDSGYDDALQHAAEMIRALPMEPGEEAADGGVRK